MHHVMIMVSSAASGPSYSGANGGNCLEVADDARVVLVRDTTDRDGGTLAFAADAWAEFLGTLR